MPIFAVQTTASYEDNVIERIASRELDGIHAVLSPEDIKAYVLVEAEDKSIVKRVTDDISHARKVLDKHTSIEEVTHMLQPSSDVEGKSEGDVVELTDGPFKGEKAQITEINQTDEQVTVELFEATVPIPVTVNANQIRVLDSEER